ncbi:hypothetical protein [Paenibacillus sp. PL91]|nr:hypothetical protein [Paenibacillus sp. PL91]
MLGKVIFKKYLDMELTDYFEEHIISNNTSNFNLIRYKRKEQEQ